MRILSIYVGAHSHLADAGACMCIEYATPDQAHPVFPCQTSHESASAGCGQQSRKGKHESQSPQKASLKASLTASSSNLDFDQPVTMLAQQQLSPPSASRFQTLHSPCKCSPNLPRPSFKRRLCVAQEGETLANPAILNS